MLCTLTLLWLYLPYKKFPYKHDDTNSNFVKKIVMPSFFLFSSPFLRESFLSISYSIEQIIIKIDTENHFEYDTKRVCLSAHSHRIDCGIKPFSRFSFFCSHFSHISLKHVVSLVSFFGELIQDFDTARLQL